MNSPSVGVFPNLFYPTETYQQEQWYRYFSLYTYYKIHILYNYTIGVKRTKHLRDVLIVGYTIRENENNSRVKTKVATGSKTPRKAENGQHLGSGIREREEGKGKWEKRRGVTQIESTVDERSQANGHLDTFFAFAFYHTSHGDGWHPQDLFPLRKR